MFVQARDLIHQIGNVRLNWIPRDQNQVADELSRQTYRRHQEKERMERAKQVKVVKLNNGTFKTNDKYIVDIKSTSCTCKDFKTYCKKYKIRCKHILAATNAASKEFGE